MEDQPQEKIPLQPWMKDAATQAVVAALRAEGQEIRFVGGCVRDAVLGLPVRDVDIATPDAPETVMALLARAGIKTVPTGIDHGTVTAISGGKPYEVTTLRKDVETFGRHARVAFTNDWRADAARRDFTINALSCSPEGEVWDYFGGIADARAGRIRFVGDPRERIAEDYLRLLRFFRFLAHYGKAEVDSEALAAAAEAAPMLAKLSGERIRDELLRLLAASNPLPTLRLMRNHRILESVLPEVENVERLEQLLALHPQADPLLRLAALLSCDAKGALNIAERLRLSKADRDRLADLCAPAFSARPGMVRKELRIGAYRYGRERLKDWLYLAASAGEGSVEHLEADLKELARQPQLAFPLRGRDLLRLGARRGPELGKLLKELEGWWIERDFKPSREALLEEARRRLGAGAQSL